MSAQADLFGESQAAPAPGRDRPPMPPAWAKNVLTQFFKTAQKGLPQESKDAFARAAWLYATERAAAGAERRPAADSERRLFGQHTLRDELGAAVALLHSYRVDPNVVPQPSAGELPALPSDGQRAGDELI